MQRKQCLVKLLNESEGNKFIKYLENEGFENIHKITFDKLRVKVLVVSKNEFFSTNATCLAALANSGIKPISVREFITRFEKQKEVTNNL